MELPSERVGRFAPSTLRTARSLAALRPRTLAGRLVPSENTAWKIGAPDAGIFKFGAPGMRVVSAQMHAWIERRRRETGHPDPLVEQSDALRIWQPRFIAGRTAP